MKKKNQTITHCTSTRARALHAVNIIRLSLRAWCHSKIDLFPVVGAEPVDRPPDPALFALCHVARGYARRRHIIIVTERASAANILVDLSANTRTNS